MLANDLDQVTELRLPPILIPDAGHDDSRSRSMIVMIPTRGFCDFFVIFVYKVEEEALWKKITKSQKNHKKFTNTYLCTKIRFVNSQICEREEIMGMLQLVGLGRQISALEPMAMAIHP
jgi:hypothetical protein